MNVAPAQAGAVLKFGERVAYTHRPDPFRWLASQPLRTGSTGATMVFTHPFNTTALRRRRAPV